MNLQDYLKTWEGTSRENIVGRVVIIAQAVALIIAILSVVSTKERVILTPYTMHDNGWVEEGTASDSYRESWGFYLATLLGNVTPTRVKFIKTRLEPLLAPEIHASTMEAIERQAQMIQENRYTYRFEPISVEVERATNKVFITGRSYTKIATGEESNKEKTYEFVINVSNYLPVIYGISVNEGQPRTEKVVAIERQQAEKTAKQESN
jgi:conjugal transfer pilus assembly protein TraE